MDRREFLRSTLAATAAAPAFGAPADLDAALQALDLRRQRLATRMAPLDELPVGLGSGDDPELRRAVRDAADALLTSYGVAALVDAADHRDERVQRRLRDASGRMGSAIGVLADRLRRLEPDRAASLHRVLYEERFADTLLQAFEAEVDALDLPRGLRRRLAGAADELAFTMRRRGTAAAVADLVERYDRLDRRVAKDPARYAGTGEDDDLDRRDPVTTVLGVLALGLGIVGAGASFVILANDPFLVVCPCISAPMFAGALLLIIAGLALMGGR